MRRCLSAAVALAMIISLWGCALKNSQGEKDAVTDKGDTKAVLKIVQISDPHYYSGRLHDDGELYNRVMSRAGGRDAIHIGEIVDAFVNKMLEIKPDAVIISGDLTLNGEKASHEDFAAVLKRMKEEGIPVFVIPGNHDINNPAPFEIRESVAISTENVSAQEFESIYSEFGYADAISRDTDSLSYMVEIGGKLAVIMFDSCIYKDDNRVEGYLSEETRLWAYSEIEKAKAKGLEVITVTHQNLLLHNQMFSTDYCIIDGESVVDELMKLGVEVNLSGHMHCMNVMKKDDRFYDVALGSIAVWPNLYATLEIGESGCRFNAASLEHESDSRIYIADSSIAKALFNDDIKSREDLSYEDMLIFDLVTDMHVNYFAGERMDDAEITASEAYGLLVEKYPDSAMCMYVDMMLESAQESSREFTID